eukprot:s173_g11.t1
MIRQGGPARRANAVLAAVLQDAAGAGLGLAAAPVAAVEESVLRLLVLHKELTAGDAAKSKLADAAAGLAPRMLQVLEAAKAVCEANRSKLIAYTEEKQLGIDRSDYLVPQMQALDKLHRQYSTLCPGRGPSGPVATPGPEVQELPQVCECGAHFRPDAHFCHMCGRPRVVAAPMSARFSPRTAVDVPPVQQSAYGAPVPSAPSLQSSPIRSAQNTGRQSGYDRPVDPGLPEPLMPALRPGGSSPPPAKFRQQTSPIAPGFGVLHGGPQSTPRSDFSSVQPASARQLAPRPGYGGAQAPVVPAIQHWDRHQELAQRRAGAAAQEPIASASTAHPMWDAVAAAVTSEARPAAVTDASPLWDAVAANVAPIASVPSAISTARSNREARLSPRAALVSGGEPLAAALHQTRGVASELLRRGRGTAGGGAHAGAGPELQSWYLLAFIVNQQGVASTPAARGQVLEDPAEPTGQRRSEWRPRSATAGEAGSRASSRCQGPQLGQRQLGVLAASPAARARGARAVRPLSRATVQWFSLLKLGDPERLLSLYSLQVLQRPFGGSFEGA